MKILMLHGYTQSAEIYSRQLGALRRAMKGIEMVFIDGPGRVHPMTETDGPEEDLDAAPSHSWWSAEDLPDGTRRYIGLDDSLRFLQTVMETERPDAIWGFSQGACLVGLLAAVMLRPELHPAFAQPADPPLKPLKFAVSVGGFRAVDPAVSHFWDQPISTPSLHVIGRGDSIVGLDRAVPYLDAWGNPRVEYHDGGHFTPSKASWRSFFYDYVKSFEGGSNGGPDIVSPSQRTGE